MNEFGIIRMPCISGEEFFTVTRLLVREGDFVRQDQPVIELETDKSTVELPAGLAGVIEAVLVAVGDKVAFDAPLLLVRLNPPNRALS